MRFPVFASNPANDRPILRKSLAYVTELLETRAAQWIDRNRPELGVRVVSKFTLVAKDSLDIVAGSGFDTAWAIRQSGYAGPNVWQLKTSRQVLTV